MNISEQITQLRKGERIVFSVVSGYNYYSIPLQSQDREPIMIALHRDTDIMYKMYPGELINSWDEDQNIAWYRQLIINPVPKQRIEWPVDVVKISFETGGSRKNRLYYVFPQKALLELEPMKRLLYVNRKNDILDWRRDQIRHVAVSFLRAMDDLHKVGYSYNDFNIEKIMYHKQTGEVYLRYTDAIRSRPSKASDTPLSVNKIAIEFAPPCQGVDRDQYAIAAILFRLMIGRLPYQGWPLEHNIHVFDTNYYDLDKEDEYRQYFREYRKSRCFVFDPDDDSNRLSPGSEDDLPRERWEALPKKVQDMFIRSLAYTDRSKKDKMTLYTPKQWLSALDYCWKKDEVDKTNG